MAQCEEAEIERNLREFVLARTAEPVYLELREGLVIIRHVSRYGSSILATFWTKVLQHPNNYPPLRFPYKKLYDTRGLWKVVLQVEDVAITIFTKTGTITIKGAYALEWFINRFQRIMDGYESPVQESQSLIKPHSSRVSDRLDKAVSGSRKLARNLDGYSEQRLSGRLSTGQSGKHREIVTEPSPRIDLAQNPMTGQDEVEMQEPEVQTVDNPGEPETTDQRSSPMNNAEQIVRSAEENLCPHADASSSADVNADSCSKPSGKNDCVELSQEAKPSDNGDTSSDVCLGTRPSSAEESERESRGVSHLIEKAKEVVFDLMYDRDSVSADVEVTDGVDLVDEGERYRQEWLQLNETLKVQELDLLVGEELDAELQQLTAGCAREGSTYVYPLWRSLLHKFMSTKDCKIYMASPFMDKARLLDICHALLRNRLTACVDTVCVQRHCNSTQLISDLKRSVVREFTTTNQVFIEYKLYSSFVYPFRPFHYSFLAGVTDGLAEVMVTSADFHADHFDSDTLDSVTYQKMSEDEFRIRYLGPLTLRNDIPSL